MTPFERALRERIKAEGSITVEAYMEACNGYYYATRDPLGADGDFTTAPEISQMFGEMIGAALADCWKRAGSPKNPLYVELGPGKGTLARDALRVMRQARLDPEINFVESSPLLRDVQGEMFESEEVEWHESLVTVCPGFPLLVVANEFFDALPVRQFVDGVERRVVWTPAGLAFDRDGEIAEDSPIRAAAAREIGAQIDVRGGVAIIIDYGHLRSAFGDTLQAVRRHSFAPVLRDAGEEDLTSHVDFEALAEAGSVGNVRVTEAITQGEWLMRLGIEERAQALSRANPDHASDVEAALHRLTASDEMGALFKVIAIHSPNWPSPAGFA